MCRDMAISKPRNIRFEKWLDDLISSKVNKKKKETKNWTKALHYVIRKLLEENKDLKHTVTHLKEQLSLGTSEEQVIRKALGFDYPECHFMLEHPKKVQWRICIMPNKNRSVALPRIKGEFVVKDPKICLTCKQCHKPTSKESSEEKIKRFHKEKKRQVHILQARVNQTLAEQRSHNGRTGKNYFTNEHGQRIPY
jgi:regulator of replication initiation timing